MLPDMLLAAVAAHLIGDFYLQSADLSERKRNCFGALVLHGIIYGLPFLLFLLFYVFSSELTLFIAGLIAAHFSIDLLKTAIQQWLVRLRKKQRFGAGESFIFLADQLLHLIAIFGITYYFFSRGWVLQPAKWLVSIAAAVNYPLSLLLKWITLVLVILKPANIFFAILSRRYKPAATAIESVRGDLRAGRVIGFLERLLIVSFLASGQYASIGLIMTAKSIARYEKIARDSAFAEYYLIGTLSSVLFAVVAYHFVFG